jgi:hypothetical protein
MKKKKTASICFTGVAMVGAVCAGEMPATAAAHPQALAAGVWTAKGTGTFTLESLRCPSVTASGSPWNSTTGPFSGTVRKLDFGACSDGILNLTATQKNSLKLVPAKTAAGVTDGKLSGDISIVMTSADCHMVVTGTSAPASYDNGTHALILNPANTATIKVKSVSGCDGLFTAGETAALGADLDVTAP